MSISSTIKPLYDRVAIEPIQEEKTSGGIIIPDTAKDKPSKGKVVAVGQGYRAEDGSISALSVKIGDTILYGKWGGTEVKVDDRDIIVMKESEILAILQ